MTEAAEDPRCPECGGPIGQTATYCMHCSADLTDELQAADADHDGAWDESATVDAGGSGVTGGPDGSSGGLADLLGVSTNSGDGKVLADDGLVDNTLTVVVGVVGGLIVGVVGTVVLGIVTASGWALLFGVLAWIGATAYLVRRRTVQAAVARSAYAVAAVLLLVPVIAFSPVVSVDGGRGGMFLVLLVFVAVPALVAAAVGFVASRFVPDGPPTEG